MFNIGEYVIYKHDVCFFYERKYGRNDIEYYVLIPITDNTLKIEIPVSMSSKCIRNLITKEEALSLIEKMKEIEIIKLDSKLLEAEYKKLLADGTHESLVKIIKTTYLRNKERIDSKRKVSDKDDYYFNLAEKYLYNELAIILDMSFEEVRKFIADKLDNISM